MNERKKLTEGSLHSGGQQQPALTSQRPPVPGGSSPENKTTLAAAIEEALDQIHGPREAYRPLLNPIAILRRICWTAEQRAERSGVQPWVTISEITGHGSGVSAAIYKVYGPRKEKPVM